MLSAPTTIRPPRIGLFNPPLKVLYVIDTLEVGGSEQSLLEMARLLDRRRFELVVCHVYRGDALRGEFEAAGIRVVSLGIEGKYRFPAAFRALRRLVRAEQPDVIHTTLFRANQVGRAVGRWLRIPVVSSLVNLSYDPTRLEAEPHVNRRKLAVLQALDALTARWVARFHSVSAAVRDSTSRALGVSPERIAVIPRGRCPADFAPAASEDLAALRAELALGDARPVILNVGRLVEQKGQGVLMEAMPAVVRRFPQAKLLIAGEGRLRGRLEAAAQRLGLERHVTLLGRRNDVPRLLQLADCFAFPSFFEGLPGSVVEAMFAGRAIVAADIPVIREVIDDGRTGLLVSPQNAAALAEAIVRVTADGALAAELGQSARQAAVERFDIRRIARDMEQLYAEVAGR